MKTLPLFTGDDIRHLRASLLLTQREFAARYYLPLASLRNWEQDRWALDAVGSLAFHLIAFNPDAAATALGWLAAKSRPRRRASSTTASSRVQEDA
jgi:DNA-binding transcriptional regulator YiaG